MKTVLVMAVATGLLAPFMPARAADAPATHSEAVSAGPNAPASAPAPAKKKMKMKARKPMDMAAPMKTPMAKEGMTMGDVKAQAAKKDAAMADMMKQEEAKMPAPAAR